jgi:allantoinase
VIEQVCGKRPVGWYTGRVSHNTRRPLREQGGLLYDSDAYNGFLKWLRPFSKPHTLCKVCSPLISGKARKHRGL